MRSAATDRALSFRIRNARTERGMGKPAAHRWIRAPRRATPTKVPVSSASRRFHDSTTATTSPALFLARRQRPMCVDTPTNSVSTPTASPVSSRPSKMKPNENRGLPVVFGPFVVYFTLGDRPSSATETLSETRTGRRSASRSLVSRNE